MRKTAQQRLDATRTGVGGGRCAIAAKNAGDGGADFGEARFARRSTREIGVGPDEPCADALVFSQGGVGGIDRVMEGVCVDRRVCVAGVGGTGRSACATGAERIGR